MEIWVMVLLVPRESTPEISTKRDEEQHDAEDERELHAYDKE
jgi:hypothetical protein